MNISPMKNHKLNRSADPLNANDIPEDQWISLGKLVGPFGIHGEVKLYPETDFPDRITEHRFLYIGLSRTPYMLQSARIHGALIILALSGVTTMNEAEKLRGSAVMIPQTEIAELAKDQYYIHDLIGMQAVHVNGTNLGSVADVFTNAAQDLLLVRTAENAEVFVPFVKTITVHVDMKHQIISIDPPAGMFPEQEPSETTESPS